MGVGRYSGVVQMGGSKLIDSFTWNWSATPTCTITYHSITHDRNNTCQNLAMKSSFPHLHPSLIAGMVTICSHPHTISTYRLKHTVGRGEEEEDSCLGRWTYRHSLWGQSESSRETEEERCKYWEGEEGDGEIAWKGILTTWFSCCQMRQARIQENQSLTTLF